VQTVVLVGASLSFSKFIAFSSVSMDCLRGVFWPVASAGSSQKNVNPILQRDLLSARKRAIVAQRAGLLTEYLSPSLEYGNTRLRELAVLLVQTVENEHALSDQIMATTTTMTTSPVEQKIARNLSLAQLAAELNFADMKKIAVARVAAPVSRHVALNGAYMRRKARSNVIQTRISKFDELMMQYKTIEESTLILEILQLMPVREGSAEQKDIAKKYDDIQTSVDDLAAAVGKAREVETLVSDPIVASPEDISVAMYGETPDADLELLAEMTQLISDGVDAPLRVPRHAHRAGVAVAQ